MSRLARRTVRADRPARDGTSTASNLVDGRAATGTGAACTDRRRPATYP